VGKKGKWIKKQNRKRKNAAIANGTYSKRGKSDGMYKIVLYAQCGIKLA
jgi:hypothetical protein